MQQTIHVVEDDLDVLALARDFLERAGYAVVTAVDGEEGLRLYEEQHPDISLLLTDVTIPKMNGHDLAGRILKLDSRLPVVLMSGDPREQESSMECLVKPFTPGELLGCVGRALERRARQFEKEPVCQEQVR